MVSLMERRDRGTGGSILLCGCEGGDSLQCDASHSDIVGLSSRGRLYDWEHRLSERFQCEGLPVDGLRLWEDQSMVL